MLQRNNLFTTFLNLASVSAKICYPIAYQIYKDECYFRQLKHESNLDSQPSLQGQRLRKRCRAVINAPKAPAVMRENNVARTMFSSPIACYSSDGLRSGQFILTRGDNAPTLVLCQLAL